MDNYIQVHFTQIMDTTDTAIGQLT